MARLVVALIQFIVFQVIVNGIVVNASSHKYTFFDPHAFDDKHQHVMSPVSAATGLAGLAVSHLRDHALSRAPKPDLMDVLAQTPHPIIQVIHKYKIKKPKRSIGNDDESSMKYIYKSPILLKKPNSVVAASSSINGGEDESKQHCDVRDIQLEAIGEHLVRPQQIQTNGEITELNEDLSEMNQSNVRVRRSDPISSRNQQQSSQQAPNSCGTSNCPFHKHIDDVCSHGTCASSHNDFSKINK